MQAAELDAIPPGVELARVLVELDPALLDPAAQLSYIAACERNLGWQRALQDNAIVAFAGANPRNTVYWVNGDEHAIVDARRSDLVAELNWSEGQAHRRISEARALHSDLPSTRDAAFRGLLSPAHITAMAQGATQLTALIDEAVAEARATNAPAHVLDDLRTGRATLLARFESRVVPYACDQGVARCRQQIRRALASIDPAGWAARRLRAKREQSDVHLDHMPNGLSMITAILPSEQAIACMQVIDALARDDSWADVSQPIGVRRVDALVALIERHRPSGAMPHVCGRAATARSGGDGGGPSSSAVCGACVADSGNAAIERAVTRVEVEVVIDLATLVGLNDESAILRGVGPIPAEVVRAMIAADPKSTLRRIITDPRTGVVTEVSARRHVVDAATRRLIDARDTTCRFPNCTQPAHRCECDHAEAFGAGGRTVPGNLGLACKRHHQCKTHAGWRILGSDASGACTWVSPLGRAYRHQPEPQLPEPVGIAPMRAAPKRKSPRQCSRLERSLEDHPEFIGF